MREFHTRMLPRVVNELFMFYSQIPSYSTRQVNSLLVPFVSKTKIQNTLKYKGVFKWNDFYQKVDSDCRFFVFKNSIKSCLLFKGPL